MNLAGDALEKAVKAAHQEPGWLDALATVLLLCLVICAYSYFAR